VKNRLNARIAQRLTAHGSIPNQKLHDHKTDPGRRMERNPTPFIPTQPTQKIKMVAAVPVLND